MRKKDDFIIFTLVLCVLFLLISCKDSLGENGIFFY